MSTWRQPPGSQGETRPTGHPPASRDQDQTSSMLVCVWKGTSFPQPKAADTWQAWHCFPAATPQDRGPSYCSQTYSSLASLLLLCCLLSSLPGLWTFIQSSATASCLDLHVWKSLSFFCSRLQYLVPISSLYPKLVVLAYHLFPLYEVPKSRTFHQH